MTVSLPTRSQQQKLDRCIHDAHDALIAFRRDLHAHPELSWHEERTCTQIEAQLRERGISFRREIGTAVIADIPGTVDGPPVIYRADIDALPLQDTKNATAAPYRSTHEGVCHSCGHDVHATIGLAVAMCMHTLRDSLVAPVRIIFQPAEEVLPAGAAALAEAGLLDHGRSALAVHVDPSQRAGDVAWLTGPITAARDVFHITVEGSAGHSARPHLSHDAIAAAAAIVGELQAVVRRHANALQPAVISTGILRAGVAPNVIASSAALSGTLRALDDEDRARLRNAMRDTAQHVASIHGCCADVRFEIGTPPLRNDAALAALVCDAAAAVLGKERVHAQDRPSMGAEDFGMFSDYMPTFYLRLGCGTRGEPPRHLHEEGFDLDEACIAIGARIMARSILALSRAHDAG